MRTKFTLFVLSVLIGFNSQAQMALIDLTESQDPGALQSTLNDWITEDTRILLKAGSYHEITGVNLSHSLILEGAEGEKAEVKIAGWFNLDEGEPELGLIHFKNLTLHGDNPTGDYVMNISRSGKINEIIFEDCHIHSFRGVARLRPVEIGSVLVDQCMVNDIAGYGLINVDDDNGSVQDTRIISSTIAVTERVFVSKTPTNSVKIHDCTFYQTPRYGRSFIDMADAASVIEGGVEVINSILTSGLNGDPNTGVRAGETTPVTITNSYYTNDFNWNALQWRTAEENPFILYDGTAETLFVNAEEHDFTIADGAFVGANSAGDPRLYYVSTNLENGLKVSDVEVKAINGQIIISENVSIVEVYALTGQLVISAGNVSSVSLDNLGAGVYIVKAVDNKGGVSITKIIN